MWASQRATKSSASTNKTSDTSILGIHWLSAVNVRLYLSVGRVAERASRVDTKVPRVLASIGEPSL